MTPKQRDEFRLATAARIMAALTAYTFEREYVGVSLSQGLLDARREYRAKFAADEAEALLTTMLTRVEVLHFADGEEFDPFAADPTRRTCAHGVALADECAKCASGDMTPPSGLASS